MSQLLRTKCVLLAAGLGTRLRPLTDSLPKCLVDIAGKPLLDYWFDALERASIHEVLVNTHHLPQLVRGHLEELRAQRGFAITEAYEPKLLGSAGTISRNRAFADGAQACLVVYADNLSNLDLQALLRFHEGHGDPFTMALFRTTRPNECGIAALDAHGKVIEFQEKPTAPKSDLANAGVYVVSAEAYREIADLQVFDFGFDVIPRFVGRMHGFLHEGYHLDIGHLEALERARREAPSVFGASR